MGSKLKQKTEAKLNAFLFSISLIIWNQCEETTHVHNLGKVKLQMYIEIANAYANIM